VVIPVPWYAVLMRQLLPGAFGAMKAHYRGTSTPYFIVKPASSARVGNPDQVTWQACG
jgi:hypothetical protein